MSVVKVTDKGGCSWEMLQLDNGYRVPIFGQQPEVILDICEKLDYFQFREDDVMLCSFPKTGTNWLYEVIGMIMQQKAERIKTFKLITHLEAVLPEPLADLPSPRILNTHVHYRLLPKDMKEKQVKTVLVMRNPKDTAVSYYNHTRALKYKGYLGSWKDWLPCYLDGELEYGTYESYLLEFERAMSNPGFPLYVLYYEDLKENGPKEIKKLAQFLGSECDHELCAAIERMCSFDKMKKEKINKEMRDNFFNGNMDFFRKGEIGDWKNWFTMSQNEMFDSLWNERMNDSRLKFKYVSSQSQ